MEQKEERWAPIKGYEGYYEISEHGVVVSIERRVKFWNSTRHVKRKIKAITLSPYGYPLVTLCKDRKSRQYSIHRLLAEAFIPNPENKPYIDHINADRTDYRLENLRWVTAKENANNPITLSRCRANTYTEEVKRRSLETKKRKGCKSAPKAVCQYTKEGVFIAEYESALEASRQTGIRPTTIGKVCRKCDRHYYAGGYGWCYKGEEYIPIEKIVRSNSRAVLQFDRKTGEFLKEWSSIGEAAESIGTCGGNLGRSIRTNKWRGKYIWKYKDEYEVEPKE